MPKQKQFPNGFKSWQETHYGIVERILWATCEDNKQESLRVVNVLQNEGSTALMDLALELTDKFEKKYTPQIANELEAINKNLVKVSKPYLLIGFGRWGSSDPWLGIPVNWGQVSGAKAVVEAAQENMNVEFSQGSHFFHNLTSFKVSYFSIKQADSNKINWNWLSNQKIEQETEFVRHVCLPSPLIIKVDGRRRGVIVK